MNGVSCGALGLLFDSDKADQIPLDSLLDGLGVTAKYVSNPSNRISWDVFTAIIDRVEAQLGDAQSLREFGENNVATDSFRIFKFVGRALSHPRDIYLMGAYWMGPSIFPMTTAEMTELPDGRLIQRLTIRDGHRDCPGFFYILQGCLAAGPVALGHGYSKVELDLKPKFATFTIYPSTTSKGWPGRIIRAIRTPFTVPSMLRELRSQQSTLGENYSEILDAHSQIAAQADELEKVNSIGRRLSEHIELDRVADVLIKIMIDELKSTGVELSLIRSEAPPAATSQYSPRHSHFVRSAGQTNGNPTHQYLLEAATRPLGSLLVWRSESDSTSTALLERLLPWISLALDNARTYETLERHAADLEERVKERTSRLLAANHHLVREIDQRKKATDALTYSEAQRRAAERLASMGTLAAGIAHEINNPMGSILAAAQLAELVRDEPGGDKQVLRLLREIVTQTKRCGEIVRSVLQFSRDEPTEKWNSELNLVVRRSIKLAEPFATENAAKIHTDLPKSSPWARINPIQIEQAIVNLIRNAIESGSKQVWIGMHENKRERLALIEIRDDGPGVSEADRLRIFEPFFTTKQKTGGTGLGLSVVHGIATEHGGGLKLDTREEGGTAVLFEIPTGQPPTPALEEKPDDNETSAPS